MGICIVCVCGNSIFLQRLIVQFRNVTCSLILTLTLTIIVNLQIRVKVLVTLYIVSDLLYALHSVFAPNYKLFYTTLKDIQKYIN